MKRTSIIIFSILLSASSFAQSKDSANSLADFADKLFKWDIQKLSRSSVMLLEVKFQKENSDIVEYLKLTVAKDTSTNRPAFITVKVPNNILRSNGIFIAFANFVNTKDEGRKMELIKGNVFRANFEDCSDSTCTTRFIDGYLNEVDSNNKIDIFEKFFEFDNVLFLLVYPDKSHKSIAVPLAKFKAQYKTL